MKYRGTQSNQVILEELGNRIRDNRIAREISQNQLSEKTGVSVRTIQNVESGKSISLANLISILRVLRLVENLDLLIPEQKVNPYDMLNIGKRRQRVSKKIKKDTWKWGDEE